MKYLNEFFVMIAVFMTVLSVSCLAADEVIAIESLTFESYVDENGDTDENLLSASITFAAETEVEQFSLLLMSENITAFDDISASKIIYIDQFASPKDGAYEFVVEKSRIASASNQTDIDGTLLYAKMGGMGVGEATLMTVVYDNPAMEIIYGDISGDGEINISDAIFVAQALASSDIVLTEAQRKAADVNCDGSVNISDAILLQQHLASPDIMLGPGK